MLTVVEYRYRERGLRGPGSWRPGRCVFRGRPFRMPLLRRWLLLAVVPQAADARVTAVREAPGRMGESDRPLRIGRPGLGKWPHAGEGPGGGGRP